VREQPVARRDADDLKGIYRPCYPSCASHCFGENRDCSKRALAEIKAFVGEIREGVEIERRLTTVLFTDIVDSTQKAAELGDRRWSELIAGHHRRVRSELARFRGQELDTAGDGFFASFDGPTRAIRCVRDHEERARARHRCTRRPPHR
jgi:class 3 adenylate cyclase